LEYSAKTSKKRRFFYLSLFCQADSQISSALSSLRRDTMALAQSVVGVERQVYEIERIIGE
jgi:hypothetical protein